jgi:hypothetical protein
MGFSGQFARSDPELLMSALGQKQTFGSGNPMSALPPKADIGGQYLDVCFVPEADSCAAAKISAFAPRQPNARRF